MTASQTADAPTRMSISLFPAQLAWLQRQADSLDVSLAEVLRRVVQAAMTDSPAVPEPEAPEPELPPLEAIPSSLPEAVRRHFTLEQAAAALGVSTETADDWLTDPEMLTACKAASWSYVLEQERKLIAIAHGREKGSRQACEVFLAAHHPSYGRVKAEVVRRQLKTWCGRVLQALRDSVPEGDAGQATLTAFQERLAVLEAAAVKDFT